MAKVGTSAVKIIDNDSDVVSVTNNRLDVNATIGVGSSTLTSYAQFDAATSPTALSDSTNGINATVTTGYIMVGDAQAAADTEGIRLNAGDTFTLPVSSTANVSIDGSASSQKVNVVIIT